MTASKTKRRTTTMILPAVFNNNIKLLFINILFLFCIIIHNNSKLVNSYPLVVEIDEESSRCFKFNIPEDDDANMIFMALPLHEDLKQDELEEWYVSEIYALTKKQTEGRGIPRRITTQLPSAMKTDIDKFKKEWGKGPSNIKLKIEKTGHAKPHQANSFIWFQPIVINNIVNNFRRARGFEDNEELGGHSVCFDNESDDLVAHVIFDIVYTSEEFEDEEDEESKKFQREHLTPLEENLDRSIKSANTILREMSYMTEREARMRQTTDSINTRIRYFSYLSVIVLISVTYIQVVYLKRYFKKKKLL